MIYRTHSIEQFDCVLPRDLSLCFEENEVCFLDIETTGFDRIKSQITVIGLMTKVSTNWVVHQLFCENRRDEQQALLKLNALLHETKCLLTFNGNAFDIPYLNSKYRQHKVPSMLNNLCSVDLFELAKLIYKGHKGLKLKDIERYLHVERTDMVSGKEVVELYYHYLRQKDAHALEQILLHNYDDIYNMKDLLQLFNHMPIEASKLLIPKPLNDLHHSLLYRAQVVGDFLEVKILCKASTFSPHQDFDVQNGLKAPKIEISTHSELDLASGQMTLRVPLIRHDNALVVDTMVLFRKPLLDYQETATQFVLVLDDILLLENVMASVSYIIDHSNPL